MELIEIYGNPADETHMRRTAIDFEMREFVPPSQPLGVSAEMASTSSLFLTAPPGRDKNFHPTPRKQLAVVLDGHVCITVSDGETIDLKPGDTFLLNDMARKGHLAAVQGEQDASFLFIVRDESRS
jgi:mannose-6-phosphate isomerase-like protein (cupin superfamily)